MGIFEINPDYSAYVKWLGNQEVPLFCIDNIFADPDGVRKYAFQREFPTSQAYYPGRHQPLGADDSDISDFCFFISELLSDATEKTIVPESVTSDFSILTTPERKLLGLQGQPHIDGTPMLGVIYLNDGDFGGTVFFRNRTTGSMSVITDDQIHHYREITQESHKAERETKFIIDSDRDWERVDSVDGIKNRLVIWPGNVFHSIEVKVPPELGTISEKRLTQRVIINRVD